MATLFNTKIKDTYQSLLKLEDNTILTTTVKNVTDGLGNASPLYMSTTRIGIGTNAPTQTLDIQGGVRINSAGTNVDSSVFIRSYFNAAGGSQIAVPNELRITRSSSILTNQNNVDTTWFFGNYAGNLYLKDQTLNIVGTNVLIGTTTDAGYKLDVNGTVRTQGTLTVGASGQAQITAGTLFLQYPATISYTTAYGLAITPTTAGSGSINIDGNNIRFLATNNGISFTQPTGKTFLIKKEQGGSDQVSFLDIAGADMVVSGYATNGGSIRIYGGTTAGAASNGNVILAHNGTSAIGNVGIGTSSPTNKLEVVGATRISTSLNVGGDGSTGSSFSSGFIAYDTGNGYAHSLVHAQAAQLFLFANPQGFAIAGYEPASSGLSASNLAFMTSSSTRMKILSNGNVLIGTTTDSGYKLDVNGSTRVKGNTLTVSASGLSSVPANYVGINFDDNPNHHEYWFAINSKKDLYGAIGIGYDRIIFPTMGNDNSTWEFNALGSYSRIKIAARNNTAGNFLDLNNSSISFCGSWTIASIDRTNRKLVFGNMSTDVHHIGVYDLVIKGAQPFEGNAGGSIANGGNVYVVGGTPSTSPTGNYGNVILAHDGTAARGNVLIGTFTDSGYKLDVNGTARVNGVLTVGSSTITGNFGAMTLSNNGVAGVSLSFTNSSFGSSNPCVLGDQGNHAHSSSQVEIRSTAKGFLPPRMTSTQRNAISSPATGLQVYDTTQNAICEYTGTAWRTISGGKQILTATTGATTVDLSLGNVTDVTLSLSTVITLSNPTVGTYVIKLIQDSVGGKTVSWPFNVLWSGSTPPTLTATANKTDVITLVYDGVNYYGTYALNF